MPYFLLVFLLLIVLIFFLIPVRIKPIKFDEKAQAIHVYQEELKYLEQKLTDGYITKEEYDTLLIELDQKSVLAINAIEKKSFSYRNTHIGFMVSLLALIAISFLFYFNFYRGTVQDWQQFQVKYQKEINTGLTNSELINQFSEDELPSYCFSLQRKILKDHQQYDKNQLTHLGRCYIKSGILSLANDSVNEGLSFDPKDPELNFLSAEIQMMASGQLDKTAIQKLLITLKANPNHFGSLWLLGLDSYQKGDYQHAEILMNQLKSSQIDNPQIASVLDKILADIHQQTKQQQAAKTNPSKQIQLSISFDPAITQDISLPKSLFIIVKSKNGQLINSNKLTIKQFSDPIEFTIDDHNPQMMKAANLSNFNEIVVQARLSLSGDAFAHEGDISSVPVDISSDQKEIVPIVINQKINSKK